MTDTLTPQTPHEELKELKEEVTNNPVSLQHRSPFFKWAGLGVLTLGLAIVIIDTTLLNVSLSYIIKDLHTDLKSLQWVITSYALVLAALTITGGRLGDLFGRRKMFMLGAIIFAVGSIIASYSHTIGILLLGESLIEGFGAALMMPATASLVVANFKGKERATAFGVWGAAAGASSAIGPLLGGWLATHYSWRWGFRINVIVAIIVILGSLWLIDESQDEHKPTLDWGGVFLSSLGLLGITYGIIESSTYGWWKAKELFSAGNYTLNLWNLSITPFAIVVGIILLVLFFLWERHMENNGKSPLVSTKLLSNRQFTSGTLTITILTLGMTGTFFSLPIYLQAVKNLNAFSTGLVFLPLSLALLIIAPVASILSRKIDPRYLIQFGLLVNMLAAFLIRSEITTTASTTHLILGLSLYGFGMGFVFAPISNVTLSAVPVEMAGEASGVNNTMRQVGTSLGAAIVGAAVLTMLGSSLVKGVQNSPVIPDQIKQQIVTNISKPDANIEFGNSANFDGAPPAVSAEIKNLANEATTKATRDGYLYAAMFALLGFAAALFLPKSNVHDEEQHLTQENRAEDPYFKRRLAAAFVIACIAIGGGIWLLNNSANKVIATTVTTDSITDIQNAFKAQAPSTATTTPQQITPAALVDQSTTTPNSEPLSSRDNLRGNQTGSTPPAQPAPVVPAFTQYTNENLGFGLTLSSDWQATTVTSYEVALSSRTGKSVSIQAYNNFSGDLSTIELQLRGSSARNISYTLFQGQQALSFTTASGEAGLAIPHNTRLYYIMGVNAGTDPVSSFHFL